MAGDAQRERRVAHQQPKLDVAVQRGLGQVRRRQEHHLIVLAGRRFDGPWRIEPWLGPPSDAAGALWVSVFHEPWWPSFLVSIDASGQHKLRYVHSGHLYSLARVTDGGRSFILAGGVNNEYSAAALTVLDENGEPATSPQDSSSRYRCDDCPDGHPLRFISFPRSELNRLSGDPFNRIQQITVTSSHVAVFVYEGHGSLRSVYKLSRTFDVESVAMSDRYWELHRQLQADGKIDHSVDACPERRDTHVRIWKPDSGWETHRIPSASAPAPR